MKKRLIFVLVLMMCVCTVLVACNNNNGNKGNKNDGTLFYGKENGITKGTFTENTSPQEICDKISEGNYTILFTDNNSDRCTSEMIKFANDYSAYIFDDTENDEDAADYRFTYLMYEYYLKEQDITYNVSVDMVVYPEYILDCTEAHKIGSYDYFYDEGGFYLKNRENRFTPKEVICNLVMSGNYTIENGNIKLINTDKSLYFYANDWDTYFNNAIIFDVGTTEATLIDECKNWRDWLNAEA